MYSRLILFNGMILLALLFVYSGESYHLWYLTRILKKDFLLFTKNPGRGCRELRRTC